MVMEAPAVEQAEKKKTVCKLKSDDEELCVPCEVANAAAALAAIDEAHPGKIDLTAVDEALEKGVESVEEWLDIIERTKTTARDEAVHEAEMVTEHLYSIICEDEPTTDQS